MTNDESLVQFEPERISNIAVERRRNRTVASILFGQLRGPCGRSMAYQLGRLVRSSRPSVKSLSDGTRPRLAPIMLARCSGMHKKKLRFFQNNGILLPQNELQAVADDSDQQSPFE